MSRNVYCEACFLHLLGCRCDPVVKYGSVCEQILLAKVMSIEQNMYKRAVEFIEHRFPTGWGGVAVIHTDDDKYLTSVALETFNASVELCVETEAMCEAQKYNSEVPHCLCVVRDDEKSPFKVLSPCGVCQERLRYWGIDVKVGVTTKDNILKFVTLNELQPYHCTGAYPTEKLEHYNVESFNNSK